MTNKNPLESCDTRIGRLTQLYNALSASNRTIVKSTTEQELFDGVCQSILHAGLKMVWIGLIDGNNIKPVAWSGIGTEYLNDIHVSLDMSKPEAFGPGGMAVRTQQPDWCQDFLNDPRTKPWHKGAKKYGWKANGAIPIFKKGQVIGIIAMYSDKAGYFDEVKQTLLVNMAEDISFALDNLANEVQLKRALSQTINLATRISGLRDPYTTGHGFRVGELAGAIAAELNMTPHQVEGVKVAGYLHDIGKIILPAEILSKPSRLSTIEYILVKEHTHFGYEILKDIDIPWPVAEVALQHHERINGSGYPDGLRGKAITCEARIVGVADVIDAMASHRPYRASLGVGPALDEIKKGSNTLYDAKVVKACLKLFERGYQFDATATGLNLK